MASPSTANTEQASTHLQARRKVLLADIRAHLHGSDDEGKMALMNNLQDVGDWAVADLLSDTEIAMLGTELNELRDIDAALQRIKAGTYGICIDCGNPIPQNRLLAQITAQRCIQCQTKTDKRHGLDHGPSL